MTRWRFILIRRIKLHFNFLSYSMPMTSTEEKMKPFFLHQKRIFLKQQVTLIFHADTTGYTSLSHYVGHTNDHSNPFFCKISFYKKRINWYTGIVISYKQQLEYSILSLLVYQLNRNSIWQPAFKIIVFRIYRHCKHYGLTTSLQRVSVSMETINTKIIILPLGKVPEHHAA